MTTLILDWSDWEGPASGWVTLTRRTWRRDPDTYQVPWQVSLRVEGRTVTDVRAVAGEVVSIRWAPDGVSSRLEHVLVPDDGEHLAHLLERVDPSTLEPLDGEAAVTAQQTLERAEAAAAEARAAAQTAEATARPGFVVTEPSPGVLALTPLNGALATLDADTGVLTLEVPA